MFKKLFLGNLCWSRKFPFIKARYDGGDGLASVAMLFSFHGLNVSILDLELKYKEMFSEVNLQDIVNIFTEYNFETRAFSCTMDDLSKIKLPAILYWNMKQFVVLYKIHNGKYVIYDPFSKKQILGVNDFSRQFCDVALEVEYKVESYSV